MQCVNLLNLNAGNRESFAKTANNTIVLRGLSSNTQLLSGFLITDLCYSQFSY